MGTGKELIAPAEPEAQAYRLWGMMFYEALFAGVILSRSISKLNKEKKVSKTPYKPPSNNVSFDNNFMSMSPFLYLRPKGLSQKKVLAFSSALTRVSISSLRL